MRRNFIIIGVLLLILGSVMFAFEEIKITQKEKVVEIGPFEAERKRERSLPLSPVLSGIVCVGGVVLVIAGLRKRA